MESFLLRYAEFAVTKIAAAIVTAHAVDVPAPAPVQPAKVFPMITMRRYGR
jgi:hypothetical protein